MQARDRVIEVLPSCQHKLQPLQEYNYNCYDESTGKCHGTDPVGWSEVHGGSCYCYDLCRCILGKPDIPTTTTTTTASTTTTTTTTTFDMNLYEIINLKGVRLGWPCLS